MANTELVLPVVLLVTGRRLYPSKPDVNNTVLSKTSTLIMSSKFLMNLCAKQFPNHPYRTSDQAESRNLPVGFYGGCCRDLDKNFINTFSDIALKFPEFVYPVIIEFQETVSVRHFDEQLQSNTNSRHFMYPAIRLPDNAMGYWHCNL